MYRMMYVAYVHGVGRMVKAFAWDCSVARKSKL